MFRAWYTAHRIARTRTPIPLQRPSALHFTAGSRYQNRFLHSFSRKMASPEETHNTKAHAVQVEEVTETQNSSTASAPDTSVPKKEARKTSFLVREPEPEPPKPANAAPLPLPAPEDVSPAAGEQEGNRTTTVEVNGQAIALDHLGPTVVNRDGTLGRIANWPEMTPWERENTLRVLGKRNQLRLADLRGKNDI